MNKIQKQSITIGECFAYQWKHPPAPFNPEYKPYAKKCWEQALAHNEKLEPFKSKKDRKESLLKEYDRLIKLEESCK